MSMKLTIPMALLAAFLAAQSPAPRQQKKGTKAPPKASTVERYDPDHLAPGEVACGREKPGVDPCKCMEHRSKVSEEAQAQCERIGDRAERARCMVSNEACNVTPVDVDSAGYNQETGEKMPSQCKRSCTKARCECCKS